LYKINKHVLHMFHTALDSEIPVKFVTLYANMWSGYC